MERWSSDRCETPCSDEKPKKDQQFIADVVGIAVKMRASRVVPLTVIRVSMHVPELIYVVFDSLREAGAIVGPFPFAGLAVRH